MAQVGGSDITEGRVKLHDMTFTGNELLCGPEKFLMEHTNVRCSCFTLFTCRTTVTLVERLGGVLLANRLGETRR